MNRDLRVAQGAGSDSKASSGTDSATRNRRIALAVLGLSVLARLLWMLVSPNGMNLVDLHVYVGGAADLGTGHLYDFTYSDVTPDFPLPFTYPPFAAVMFYPLHYLPFTAVAVAWLLLIVVAMYAVVRLSFALLSGDSLLSGEALLPGSSLLRGRTLRAGAGQTAALGWTAVGLWLEPTRTTLDYGQVNVFLVWAGMAAAYYAGWRWSGALVGLAAGVKLTPAVTGLYFLTRRRWSSAASAAAVFAATIGVSFLISSSETRTYFGPLIGDANRIGPVGSVWNQSVRGALTRILGYDAGAPWTIAGHRLPFGPWWLAGVLVVAVLALFAWRALGSTDRLGALLVVQLFGLMVSPISWSHHWVWLLPLIMWLLYGPMRDVAGARILAGYWLVNTVIGVPWVLSFFQPTIWTISRPGILSWLGAVDVIGVLALYVWVIRWGRRTRAAQSRARGRADDGVPAG